MDAVEFFKEKERMCSKYGMCAVCPADRQNNGFDMYCDDLEVKKPEELVAIVERWSAEHPKKTRQSRFLEMFPNAKIEEGCLLICPIHCDKNEKCGAGRCVDCRKKYWLSEID